MTETEYAFEREDGEALGVPAHLKKAADEEGKVAVKAKTTNVGVNLNCDPGMLLVEDCQSFADIDAKEFSKRCAANLCTLYKSLFDIKKAQDAVHGPDGEILEHEKSEYLVEMPDAIEVLPREKPCPVEKSKTKWEKFRDERGMTARPKRSRLIFDTIT